MAESLLVGAAVGAVFGELLKAVLEMKDKVIMFKQTLGYLQTTLLAIAPIIKEIEQHNNDLGRPKEELESLIKEMEKGTELIYKCSKISKLNLPARIRYQKQLSEFVDSLLRFFIINIQAQSSRDQKETLLKVRRIQSAVNKLLFLGMNSASEEVIHNHPILEATGSKSTQLGMNVDEQVIEDSNINGLLQEISQVEAKILLGPHEGLESNLEAIDQVTANIRFFNNANELVVQAIAKLENEFRLLLTNHSIPLEPELLFKCLLDSLLQQSADGQQSEGGGRNHSESQKQSTEPEITFTHPTLIPPRVIHLLHDSAQQIVVAGHQQQLLRIYRHTRALVLKESLGNLGVKELSKDDIENISWEVLESKIGNWINNMRIAVKFLFTWEKTTCDQIYEGLDSLKSQCFAEVTASSVAMLLSFGEAYAQSTRSPERLFVSLDMYEMMRELQPEFETLFESKACTEMREAALSLTKGLAKMIQETLGYFAEAIENDATKTAKGGDVHLLTGYVIKYIKFIFESLIPKSTRTLSCQLI